MTSVPVFQTQSMYILLDFVMVTIQISALRQLMAWTTVALYFSCKVCVHKHPGCSNHAITYVMIIYTSPLMAGPLILLNFYYNSSFFLSLNSQYNIIIL